MAINTARLHLRYIERDGVDEDGSKGVFYDADGPARRATFEQPRIGEQHQFRLIVSPEDAVDLDLTDYVRRLMRKTNGWRFARCIARLPPTSRC